MGDYLSELIDAFVMVYNAEANFKNIVVFGGDDVSRERFCDGLKSRGLPVSSVGGELSVEGCRGKYSIGLGYYLERQVLPKVEDTCYKLGELEEVRSLGVRISSL